MIPTWVCDYKNTILYTRHTNLIWENHVSDSNISMIYLMIWSNSYLNISLLRNEYKYMNNISKSSLTLISFFNSFFKFQWSNVNHVACHSLKTLVANDDELKKMAQSHQHIVVCVISMVIFVILATIYQNSKISSTAICKKLVMDGWWGNLLDDKSHIWIDENHHNIYLQPFILLFDYYASISMKLSCDVSKSVYSWLYTTRYHHASSYPATIRSSHEDTDRTMTSDCILYLIHYLYFFTHYISSVQVMI